ncbi:MAG: hypothetical protein WC957_08805 [Candidatus Neomarinimicrobiota bacterium]|jgi:NADH:ubiquinone oxidoreductase subunit K
MKYLMLYQIISAGLFIFGCYGIISHRSRRVVIVFLQLMASGIILSLLAAARILRNLTPADELTIILIFGILAAETLLAIIFTFKILLSNPASHPDDKAD